METIFWPSPARCSRVRGRILHARGSAEPRPPRCRDGKKIAGCFTSELGKAGSQCGGNCTADRTSWPREGRGGLDRPGRRRGTTSLSLYPTPYIFVVCRVCKGRRVPKEPKPGPSRPDRKSARHPRASRGVGGLPPAPGRASRSATPPRVWRRTSRPTASPCRGGTPLPLHPPLAGSFVPSAAGFSSRLLGEPLSWRPRGSGSPQLFFFFFVRGVEGEAETRTLTVHPGEEKQDQRRPPPRRLFCVPATGHNHGRWRERGGGGAGARSRRRRRAPGGSLRSPRRREGEGPGRRRRRPRALPPSGPLLSPRRLPPPHPPGVRARALRLRGTPLPGAGVAGTGARRGEARRAGGRRATPASPHAAQADPRPPPPARQREPAPAPIRAIGDPLARLPWSPPPLPPPDFLRLRGRVPRDGSRRSKAAPIDE